MSLLVIDASVAAKWFFEEEHTTEARGILGQDVALIAPELLIAELTNLGWKKAQRGEADIVGVRSALSGLPDVIDAFVPMLDLAERALRIAESLDHPAYDCLYLALAEIQDTRLVTADRRLLAKVVGTAIANRVQSLTSSTQ